MEIKLIKDVFPDYTKTYFFASVVGFLNLDTSRYNTISISVGYFHGRSGNKICSPYLLGILGDSESADAQINDKIGFFLRSMFYTRWTKLLATTTADYNPIHNYDMSEQVKRELSGDRNNTNTRNLTDTTNHGMTNTSDDYIYGFNSGDANPSNKYTSTDGGTTTVLNTGTDVNDTMNHETEDITRTRSGNIGVTTTQQMLQQERDLWNWNFIEQIYKDIDSVLTLPIYDSCRV